MKSIYRSFLLFLSVIILSLAGTAGVAAAPSVAAYSAVVMDGDTGAYYYEKDADTMRAPASMTKLMSAYVIFEEIDAGRISYDSVVTISAHGAAVAHTAGYSNVPLNQGEQYTVDTMLKLMLLPSACGACSSMADYISGSESAFAARMNEVGASIGMNCNFKNSHGAVNHYVTPRSMAILAYNFVKKHPDILRYTSLRTFTIKGRTYSNTNHFLNSTPYEGVDGMKTGTSSAAGSCITVTAQRNGRRLVVVVMHSADRYGDGRKLLDYGFQCIAENDSAADQTVVSLSTSRDTVRMGADYEATAVLGNIPRGFLGSGGWTVNETTVETFGSDVLKNGMTFSHRFNLDAASPGPVTIGFYLNLPNGQKKEISRTCLFSAEAPCAFRDMDGHWAENAVTEMKGKGMISGYPDGSFLPGNDITRGEFTTLFVRLLEIQGQLVVDDSRSTFVDTQGHWADRYIAAAEKAGFAQGLGDGSFGPDRKITRQEITTLLSRAYGLTGKATKTTFADDGDIADWAYAGVIGCAEKGVLSGYPDGTFRPGANATRAEAAALLSRCSGESSSE